MFDHLDDPAPPLYDRSAVLRKVRAVQRRRRRRLWASAGSVMTAAALVAGLTLADGHGPARVVTGPAGTVPTCATPADQSSAVTVYDHPVLNVGWLPPGYHQVSGSPSPPNNLNPLTFASHAAAPDRIQVVFDVGISAQQLPPPAGVGHGFQVGTVDIHGRPAGLYKTLAEADAISLEWTPGPDMALKVTGINVNTATLEQVARSVTSTLGPPTVITASSYLGPVIPYSAAISSPAVRHAFPALFAHGTVAGKLASYAEVRAALGANEIGGTDAAAGLPVWLLYNQGISATSWGLVDAVSGAPIEGGSTDLVDGHADPTSTAWIAHVPDHQHIQPCMADVPADLEPPAIYAIATQNSATNRSYDTVVAISPTSGTILRTLTSPPTGSPAVPPNPSALWSFQSLTLSADGTQLVMSAATGRCADTLARLPTGGGSVQIITTFPAGYDILGSAPSPDADAVAATRTSCSAANQAGDKTATSITSLKTGSTHDLAIPSSDGTVTDWGGPQHNQLLLDAHDRTITIVTLRADQTIAGIRTLPPPNPLCQLRSPRFVGNTALIAAIEECPQPVPALMGNRIVEIDPNTGATVRTLLSAQPNANISEFTIDKQGSWIAYETFPTGQAPPDPQVHVLHAGQTTTLNTPSRLSALTW